MKNTVVLLIIGLAIVILGNVKAEASASKSKTQAMRACAS
jgi:hypothetical protein